VSAPPPDPHRHIRYITPEPGAARSIGGFDVRPDVPLPVEIEGDPERVASQGISWEAIISAMLKVLAYASENEHAGYYREFVRTVRPEIDAELTQAAIAKARARDFAIAIEILLCLEGLFPENARHAVNLALVYEERAGHERERGHEETAESNLELAFDSYRRAIEVDPDLPDARFYLAAFHLRQQNYDKAHAELSAYLALRPDDPVKKAEALTLRKEIESRNLTDDLFRGAYDFIRMGQEEKGIARITEFLAGNAKVWNAWFLLGWAHRRMRHYDEARRAFARAVELGERNVDLLNELAICSMELDDLEAARRHLEEALGIDSENVKVLSNLGVVSLREGKTHDAEVYFRLVLDIDPEDPVARDTLTRLGAPAPEAPRPESDRPDADRPEPHQL
jgi:tetratricopeptide (TPR) repeat protein